jgi:hypothetical protein
MSYPTKAEGTDRRAMLYHGDGLLDIVVGLGILLFGLSMLFDLTTLSGVYIVLLIPILPSLKRSITAPRLHSVESLAAPDPGRRMRKLIVTAVLGLVVLLTFGLLVLGSEMIPEWLTAGIREHGLLLFGFLLAGLLALIGWAAGVGRMYAYAALTALTFTAGNWLGLDIPVYVTLLGAVIVLSGIGVLIRFVRRYPKAARSSG